MKLRRTDGSRHHDAGAVNFYPDMADAVAHALAEWASTGTAHDVRNHADGGFVVVPMVTR